MNKLAFPNRRIARNKAAQRDLHINHKDLLLFFVGILSLIKVRFFGTFALAELLAIASIFFIPWWRCLDNKKVRTLISLAFLWLTSVLISDLYNDSTFINSIKGAFNVILLILDIPFVYWAFNDRPRRILYYWLGVGIGSLIQFYYFSSYESEFEYDVWRVYAYDIGFIALSGYLYFRGLKKISLIVIEGFAVWSLFHSSRNIFLCATIAVVLLMYIERIIHGGVSQTMATYRKKTLFIFGSVALGAIIASNAYEYTASKGILGELAYNKYQMQKNTEAGLASGRLDFVISWHLITENPIWGYGSYALDKDGYKNRYLERHGYEVQGEEKEDNMLPGHSYFLGAWVYSGILSVPFWGYVLYQLFLCLSCGTFLKQPRIMGLVVLLMCSYLWKILFSPFADRILIISFLMILLFLKSNNEYWSGGQTFVPSRIRSRYHNTIPWSRFR